MMETGSLRRASFRYVIAAITVYYFYKHFIKPFLSPLRKIPGCPYRPIVGNLLESLRQGATNCGLRWMQKYQSRIIRFYSFGGEGTVLVGDPDIARHILVSNSKNYHRRRVRYLEQIIPGFLAMLNGEKHHSIRRLINPVFNSHTVEGFIPVFEKTTRKVIKAFEESIQAGEESAQVNAQDYMARLALDVICECGFDYDMKAVESDHSREIDAFKRILGGQQLSVLRLFGLDWLPTKKNRQIWADMQLFRSVIHNVIERKQTRLSQGSPRDILSLLLQATDDQGLHLDKENLYGQVGGFLIAGVETTNMALTWTLLSLAEHPDIQEKARQEVMSLLPDRNKPVKIETVGDMSYLTCVIKESLRLFPPLSTMYRQAVQDDVLQGYFIPAGTLVGINLGALHRLPELWPDPLTFKPERFEAEYDKFRFLPFLAGPYGCVGQLFSMAEAKVALSLILRHFRISLPRGYAWRTIRKLTIEPSPPLQLVITPV